MADISIQSLKGVGAARAAQLAHLGIATVEDMLSFLPRDYQDDSALADYSMGRHSQRVRATGQFTAHPGFYAPRSGLSICQTSLNTEKGRVACLWYNQPWVTRLPVNSDLTLAGQLDLTKGYPRLINPEIHEADPAHPILPVYPLTQGLGQKQLRRLVLQALTLGGQSPIPQEIFDKLGLMPHHLALEQAHFPSDMESMQRARSSLTMEDLCCYAAMMERRRMQRLAQGPAAVISAQPLQELLDRLPYIPTGAQQRALAEIAGDLSSGTAMNRLVQGDVGCGKTLLALAALYLTAKAGYQGALMAPTEVLARQLYQQAKEFLEPLGIRVGALIAGSGTTALKEGRQAIADGTWDIAVGTHALIQESVHFPRLALAVTDEQHRFGVRQRAALLNKGKCCHMLVMSATPVPRTLALLVYADLDLSRVDELPPGRKPVQTRFVRAEKRRDMLAYLAKEIAAGQQVYFVCPAIDESETMRSLDALTAELADSPLAHVPIGVLHGRMESEEKAAVLEDFRQGRTNLLLSTTVIEVGVNVPSASIMVIDGADRFGLAQLHQLRGRVGRGNQQAYCFLLADALSEQAQRRLGLMTRCNDGFLLAEEDLKLRGPGEFLGTRQAGAADWVMQDEGSIARVQELIRSLHDDPALNLLADIAEARLGRLDMIAMN